MKRIALAAISLALVVGCSARGSSFVVEQLASKASRQSGPKTLLSTGIASNGQPWVLDVYRIDDGRICLEHAWKFNDGHDAEATCTRDNRPRSTFQNWSTFPGHDDTPPDETPWLLGIVLDTGKAVKVRATRGEQTQIFSLIRSSAYPGNAFYVGRTTIPELPEEIELLDANGAEITSSKYVQE